MKKESLIPAVVVGLSVLAVCRMSDAQGAAVNDAEKPRFTSDGKLPAPKNYREWIFLSSGLGMTYGPLSNAASIPDDPQFDNVFVNPSAYHSFLKTGVWPENTTLVLEVRGSASRLSINKGGRSQQDVQGIEVEVKDSKRFPGKWAFFDMSDGVASARPFGPLEDCYVCHSANGAVDNTFVQFYPTLIKVARDRGTFHVEKTAE